MSSQGVKRKLSSCQDATAKKPRIEDLLDNDSDCSAYDQSDASTDADAISRAGFECATPLTPISSKSTPRFPSSLKTIPCTFPNCEKTFNRPAKLTQHLRSHTNTRPFVCPHQPCTKDFLRESHMVHHIKSAHSDVREFLCPREGCGKSFVTGTRLRRHQAVHDGADKFRCGVAGCGQSFRKHGTLQKHTKLAHEGKIPFVCHALDDEGEECGVGFDTAGRLKSHEGRVHGSKRFWCTECSPQVPSRDFTVGPAEEGTAFPTYAALQAHIIIEHPPTCLECGLQCKSHRDLKSHMDIRHSDLGVDERRTHACPEPGCGRGFTKKGNLTMHIKRVHEGKVFICGSVELSTLNNVEPWDGSDACGHVLKTKQTLEEHIRTAHLGLDYLRKHKRKEPDNGDNNPRSRKKVTSALLRLTGAGYENGSGRDITCLIQDCKNRFMREYDLEMHLESHHGLSSFEVQTLLGNEDLVRRPTLNGSSVFATSRDLEAEQALDMQFRNDAEMQDIQETLHEALTRSLNPSFDDDTGETSRDGIPLLSTKLDEQRIAAEEQSNSLPDMEMIDPALR